LWDIGEPNKAKALSGVRARSEQRLKGGGVETPTVTPFFANGSRLSLRLHQKRRHACCVFFFGMRMLWKYWRTQQGKSLVWDKLKLPLTPPLTHRARNF